MTLYDIDKRIEEAMERAVDMETGEIINDEAMAELEQLDMDRNTKIENTAKFYKNLVSDVKELKEEAKKLTERAQAAQRKADSLKNYLSFSLNGQAFKQGTVAISYRKSTSVQIDNIKELPAEYLRHKEPEPDKTAIKLALQADPESVPGASLIETQNIQIK